MKKEVINLDKWFEVNKKSLQPPVCNRLIFDGQLKVFLVGGPNQREDYHINNGEEIFIMLKGDMVLKVIEQGRPRDIPIKEGEIFLLPGRIPHSPQRQANTLGMVIERRRLSYELDCVRFYCDNFRKILFEKWFHCIKIDCDIGPILQSFSTSKAYKTQIPQELFDSYSAPHPVNSSITLSSPFSLLTWFKSNRNKLIENFIQLFPDSCESRIGLYGQGRHTVLIVDDEAFIWHLGSSAKLDIDGSQCRLGFNDCMVIDRGQSFILTSDGPTLIASMAVRDAS